MAHLLFFLLVLDGYISQIILPVLQNLSFLAWTTRSAEEITWWRKTCSGGKPQVKFEN